MARRDPKGIPFVWLSLPLIPAWAGDLIRMVLGTVVRTTIYPNGLPFIQNQGDFLSC